LNKSHKHLLTFLVATFLWTWVCYAPIAIGHHNPYEMPWTIFLFLGGAGPSLIGVVLVLLTYAKPQRRDFWQRCFSFKRINILGWLMIVLVFPLIVAVSIAIDLLTGGSMPAMTQLKELIANPLLWPLVAFISFMSGPWSEEFGWRGFALDRLINFFGVIRGSLVLGLIWAVWHLPLYFMLGTWHSDMGFKVAGFWTFIVMSIGLSLIMTAVYLTSNRSILSGMLLHFTSNFTMQLIAPSSDTVEVLRSLLMLVVGLTACLLVSRVAPQHEGHLVAQ
jgi:uncharacterized protein